MTKRILVPLDQSPLAESVLPLVADVARGAGAMRVSERVGGPTTAPFEADMLLAN